MLFLFIDFNHSESQNKKNEMTIEQINKFTSTMGKSVQRQLNRWRTFLRSDIFEILRLISITLMLTLY